MLVVQSRLVEMVIRLAIEADARGRFALRDVCVPRVVQRARSQKQAPSNCCPLYPQNQERRTSPSNTADLRDV